MYRTVVLFFQTIILLSMIYPVLCAGCPEHWFGENCTYECSSICRNGACNEATGVCSDGTCLAGYENSSCYVAGRFNAAQGKRAWQSSHHSAGHAGPQAAVDGCYNGNYSSKCCSDTGSFSNPSWWSVDLGQMLSIYAVAIFNADGLRGESLRNFTITGSNISYNPSQATDSTVCAHHDEPFSDVKTVVCEPEIKARYVTIQKTVSDPKHNVLSLCEVVVEAACRDMRYGENCVGSCYHCKLGPCEKETGLCPGGECHGRFFGPSCDMLPKGVATSTESSQSTDKTNKTKEKSNNTGLIVALAVVSVVLFVGVVFVITCVVSRRIAKQKKLEESNNRPLPTLGDASSLPYESMDDDKPKTVISA